MQGRLGRKLSRPFHPPNERRGGGSGDSTEPRGRLVKKISGAIFPLSDIRPDPPPPPVRGGGGLEAINRIVIGGVLLHVGAGHTNEKRPLT